MNEALLDSKASLIKKTLGISALPMLIVSYDWSFQSDPYSNFDVAVSATLGGYMVTEFGLDQNWLNDIFELGWNCNVIKSISFPYIITYIADFVLSGAWNLETR